MRKILLYIIVILLSICTYLSISYAYYSVNPTTANNMATNVVIDGCLSLSVSNTISITGDMAIPINDAKALSSDDYRVEFTVHNRCTTAQQVQMAFAPGADNTMPATALKYAIYEQTGTAPTTGTVLSGNEITLNSTVISDVATITGDTVSTGYLMGDSIILPASSTKSYYAYLWIAKDEGGTSNTVINKVLKMHLVFGSFLEYYSPPTGYWYDTTYTYSNPAIFPAYGGTLITSGLPTGHSVYIGQGSDKYYTCLIYNGSEVCLSQPFTQYGLAGHSTSNQFTEDEYEVAKQVLYQVFKSAGIITNISDCSASVFNVVCGPDDSIACDISNTGHIRCIDTDSNNNMRSCALTNTSGAYCTGGDLTY